MVTFDPANNNVSMRVSGSNTGTDAPARSYLAGPACLGAAADGTLAGAANDLVGHVMVFNAYLSNGVADALHNLFAHQYGMATI